MAKKEKKRDLETIIDEGIKKVTEMVSGAAADFSTKYSDRMAKHAANAELCAIKRAKNARKAKKGAMTGVVDSAEAFAEDHPGAGKKGPASLNKDEGKTTLVFDVGDLVMLVLGLILLPVWVVIGIFYAFGPMGYALTRLLSALSMSFYAITQALGGQDESNTKAKQMWADVGREWAVVGKRMWITITAFSTPFGLSKVFTHAGRSYEAFRGRYESYVTSPADEANTPLSFRDRYHVVDQLPSGGSSARVYVVRAVGAPAEELHVLKYFDLSSGSHLESLVREENAVKLARRLNLISDSNLDERSFWYVMPYYKGATMTRGVLDHFSDKEDSLEGYPKRALGWTHQLLQVIAQYHDAGILHKDIKPDNLIIRDEFLYLVDIGLLTELSSDQQLTTHGTEYFRDPEMVKLALKGEKVRDVSAHKFDIYSIGAVLFFLFEGEFPVNGPLSRMGRKVPRAVQMVVSKAMGPWEKRYSDARQMLADVDYLCWAESRGDLSRVRPTDLPSFRSDESDFGAAPPQYDGSSAPKMPAAYYPPAYVGDGGHRAPARTESGALTYILMLGILCLTAIIIVGLTSGNSTTQSTTVADVSKSAKADPNTKTAQLSHSDVLKAQEKRKQSFASIRDRYYTYGVYLKPKQAEKVRLEGTKTSAIQTITHDLKQLVDSIEEQEFGLAPHTPSIVVRLSKGAGEEAKGFAENLKAALIGEFHRVKDVKVFDAEHKDFVNNWLEVESLSLDESQHERAMANYFDRIKAYKQHKSYGYFPGGAVPVYVVVGGYGDIRVFYPGAKLDYYFPLKD